MFFCAAPVLLPFAFGPLWQDALDKAGLKHEAMAAFMGMTPQAVAQCVSGHRRFPLDRLAAAATRDKDARRACVLFVRSVLLQVGADDREEALALFNDMVNQFQVWITKAMPAKADLRQSDTERRTA